MEQSAAIFKQRIEESGELGDSPAFRECFGVSNSASFVRGGFLIGIPNLENLSSDSTSLCAISHIPTSHMSDVYIALIVKTGFSELIAHLERMKGPDRSEIFSERNQNCALFLAADGKLYPHNNSKRTFALDSETLEALGPGVSVDKIVILRSGERAPSNWAVQNLRAISGTTPLSLIDEGVHGGIAGPQDFSGAWRDALTESANIRSSVGLPGRILAALHAKRFLILTGISGSGKTKIAQALARWLSPSKKCYSVIPVGADWTSREQMIGYPDGLTPDRYVKQPALSLILEASKEENGSKPFFLILDEMNLSHVERYFSDFLSAIESGEEIPMHEEDGTVGGVDGRIRLPENLFVIGTVNVDETTYMFSPKVLDRANVIEFRTEAKEFEAFMDNPRSVDLDELCEKDVGGLVTEKGLGTTFGPVLVEKTKTEITPSDLGTVHDSLKRELSVIFRLFQGHGWDFGFRVGKEISRLLYFHRELYGDDWTFNNGFDSAIVQKLMPKLNGSEGRLREILKALAWYCSGKEESIADGIYDINEIAGRVKSLSKQAKGTSSKDPEKVLAENLEGEIENATYPLSFEKTLRMWRALKLNGFTSFAEN